MVKINRMVKIYRLGIVFVLFVIIMVMASCASKPPVLTKNGRPLTIIEYEKIAQKEYEEGRYDNAIMAYKAIIKNYPDHLSEVAWANYEIGYCYYMKKDYEKAEEYFRKVVNEYNEPAAKKLSQEMLEKIGEKKKK